MLRNRTLPLHSALKPSSLHHYVAHKATWNLFLSAFILCIGNVNFFADTRHDVALALYLIWPCGTLFFSSKWNDLDSAHCHADSSTEVYVDERKRWMRKTSRDLVLHINHCDHELCNRRGNERWIVS